MSNDPQWKSFQPPIINSDPAILDFKSMAIPTKNVGGSQQSANSYRKGTNYTGDHYIMDSPPDSDIFPGVGITSPRNGSNRFNTARTVASIEGSVTGYGTDSPATNNSSYQDQSNSQGLREAGIIEKLLVSFRT